MVVGDENLCVLGCEFFGGVKVDVVVVVCDECDFVF